MGRRFDEQILGQLATRDVRGLQWRAGAFKYKGRCAAHPDGPPMWTGGGVKASTGLRYVRVCSNCWERAGGSFEDTAGGASPSSDFLNTDVGCAPSPIPKETS